MKIDDFISKMDNPDGLQIVNIKDLDKLAMSINELKRITEAKGSGDVQVVKATEALVKRIENIKVDIKSDIKQPVVNVDFKSVVQAIKSIPQSNDYSEKFDKILEMLGKEPEEKEEKLDLMCYRVSDSKEPVTGYQYFGFINPEGAWYILYNEATEGKVRYKFGKDNYQQAWDMCENLEFKLIDEAINEIKN